MRDIWRRFWGKQEHRQLDTASNPYAVKYRHFKSLLHHNHAALNAIADMEQMYHSGKSFSFTAVRCNYEVLIESVEGIIHHINALSGDRYTSLYTLCSDLDQKINTFLNPPQSFTSRDIILPFERISSEMFSLVGAKAGNLAIIKNSLGLPVPAGFAVTALALEHFTEANDLGPVISDELSRLSANSTEELERASARIRQMIRDARVPADVGEAIINAYHALEDEARKGIKIAMRSSAIGEDTEATFAGQYTTVLNVTEASLLEAYKTVLASKYSSRAIAYRLLRGLEDRKTPMCVAGVAMIDAKASGVMYTLDPSSGSSKAIQVTSVWGLGEHLVDGSTSCDTFLVEREKRTILEKHISRKEFRLVPREDGGTRLEKLPENERELPSINDETLLTLCDYGVMLESFYESPQDVEWALDKENRLFILQSRPLHLQETGCSDEHVQKEFPGHPALLSGGKTASPGVATGTVVVVHTAHELTTIPEDAIIVAKTASPSYAKVIGKIKGIITDIGSPTSHLSSVCREFGIPSLVGTGNATDLLAHGEVITLSATNATVYKGIVESLIKEARPAKKVLFDSPIHQNMRNILDRISPLSLTDPESPSFSPEGCKSVHDIIRFTHEYAVREMFGLTESIEEEAPSVRLVSNIPLHIQLIDLGQGLTERSANTTVTIDAIASFPLRALWKGFIHPGVNWEGTMNVDGSSIAGRFAASATAEFGEVPGGTSYALISQDYMNLSIRFAYHFATIDALCSEDSNQNYVSLQFSGGAGSYYGRSLRIQLIGSILERLGFQVSIKGDLINASLYRYDRTTLENALDSTGRLLASSRLVDMTISTQEDVEHFTDAFFKDDYDFISKEREDRLSGFHTNGGHWKRVIEGDHTYCAQDGSQWGSTLTTGIAGIVGKVIGKSYQEFLDTVEAYYYFPLAVVKDFEFSEGTISVKINPVGGNIDRGGGIAFGVKNIDNYFVLRLDALEHNIVLFEYVNGKRIQRVRIRKKIDANQWHLLKVEIKGATMKGYLNDELLVDIFQNPITFMEYTAEEPLSGFIGLWTKSDSVTYFDELVIENGSIKRLITF